MKIIYRKGTPEDLEEICILADMAIKAMEKLNIYQWDSIYPSKADFIADIAKKQLTVGTLDGEIAVIYTLNQECDKAYANGKWKMPGNAFQVIHRLCVKPSFQNKGIARNALENIEQTLKSSGIKSVRLDAYAGNFCAVKLYKKYGYSTVGYADWRKGRFCLMEKILT